MSRPHPEVYRDALQVSPARIAALSDSDLTELMHDLLRAQAHRCRSPLSRLTINTEGKAKDGGCDGWTAEPELDDSWLGRTATCWQFKAGVAGQPSKLKGEVIKPIPRKTLEDEGRFVVVASGSTNGVQGEADRKDVLRDEALAADITTGSIEVIGSERLTTWCNQNPAVAARWAGRPGGLWLLGDWLRAEVHQVPWQALDNTMSELEKLRAAMEFDSGTVQHLHIQGQPGVGKTRFALELCRDAPWSAFVVYFRQAADFRLPALIDSAAAEPDVRLVVVADEVQPDQLLPLRDSIGRTNGRIRLITIGHCASPEPTRIQSFKVNPLDQETAGKVVSALHTTMPPEHVQFVVRFADGYIRLALLAADAVAKDPALNIRGLLDREEIRDFLDRMLGPGDRRALHVVAVLASVGWTEEVQTEGQAVSGHLHLDWNIAQAEVEAFDRRLGIVPRGGRYRYISPTPLGNYLAIEAWRTYGNHLSGLPDALPTEGARDAYYERIRSIASNPTTKEFARQALDRFFHLADFVDARAVRRWSALSSADPYQAARNILGALTDCDIADRKRVDGAARRIAVSTLVRLAWRSEVFPDAAKALALLAEAENETWANNATAEFVGLFQIFLGGTAVPYLERLQVLDDLSNENRSTLDRLVIKALTRAGAPHVSRMVTEPASDELPEEEWKPSTRAEHVGCIESAIKRVTALAAEGDAELERDFLEAARELKFLLRQPDARPFVGRYFDAVRVRYPQSREPLRRMIADAVYRARKYSKGLPESELACLDSMHARFKDASLTGRIRELVGQTFWDREEQVDLRQLAKELLESDGVLAEEWPWLTSGDATDAWRLGEALAAEDPDGTFAARALEFAGSGRDFRILCGYVGALRRGRGDAWYDHWFEAVLHRDPRPTGLLFEVAWRCGATAGVSVQLASLLRQEEIPPEIVGQLGYGVWGGNLSQDLLENVLRAMTEGGHRATAVAILDQRLKQSETEAERWRALAVELIVDSDLIRSSSMTNHFWKELALRYVCDHPGEIAAAIFREQASHSAGIWFAEHSEAAVVLQACVKQNPGDVWQALLPHLSRSAGVYSFSVGFPAGIMDQIPPEMVLEWVREQPAERSAIVAHFANKDLSNDETLTGRMLAAYGGRKDVGEEYFSVFLSGGWSGPASAHWGELARTLDEVAIRTRHPKLKRWAMNSARKLRRMAEVDRKREEEENIRGFE